MKKAVRKIAKELVELYEEYLRRLK